MKKMLSLLAAITLTVTPITNVVACGKKDDADKDKSAGVDIFKGGALGNFTSEDMVRDLINNKQESKLFGSHDDAVHTFMDFFALQVLEELSNEKSDLSQAINKDSNYLNDGFLASIKTQYDNLLDSSTRKWNEAVESAKTEGKKWEETFRKSLEKSLNRDYKSYSDAKNDFINTEMLKGDGTRVIDSLLKLIYASPKNLPVYTFEEITKTIGAVLFEKEITINNQTIQFNKSLNKGHATNILDEFKKLLDALNSIKNDDSQKDTFQIYALPLINLINATGGLEPKDTSVNVATINGITWVGLNSFKSEVLSNSETWADEFVRRLDVNSGHFEGKNADSGAFVKNSIVLYSDLIGPESSTKYYKYTRLNAYISLVAAESNLGESQTKGLFSNGQRYFANKYFESKKPLAISEFVISPIEKDVNLDKNINNSAFINKDSSTGSDDLYRFLNAFVNGNQWTQTSKKYGNEFDYTNKTYLKTSDYSWDLLMKTKGDLKQFNEAIGGTPAEWTVLNDHVKLKEHDKLLAIDSSSSDFSDLLKYSTYDFMAKNGKSEEFKPSNPISANDSDKDNSIDVSTKSESMKEITNLINSLNRRSSAKGEDNLNKRVYQVLNKEQGIISFIDSEGIHLVRIEGYKQLLNNNAQGENKISILNQEKDGKTNINNYQAIEILNRKLGNKDANAAEQTVISNATYDWKNQGKIADSEIRTDPRVNFAYGDLNTSFGSDYLRYLANTSIIASIGKVDYAKEKYKLDQEVEDYVSTSISSASESNLWIGTWDYFKDLTNRKTDLDLFKLVFGDNSKFKTLLFANSQFSDDLQTQILNAYQSWIIDGIHLINKKVSLNWNSLTNKWDKWKDSESVINQNVLEDRLKPINTLANQTNSIINSTNWTVKKGGK